MTATTETEPPPAHGRVERDAFAAHRHLPAVDLHLPATVGSGAPLVLDVSGYADASGGGAEPASGSGSWVKDLTARGLAVAVLRARTPGPPRDAAQTVRALVRLLRAEGGRLLAAAPSATPSAVLPGAAAGTTDGAATGAATGPVAERLGLLGVGDGAYLAALAAYGSVDLRSQVQAVVGIGGDWGAHPAPPTGRRPGTRPRRHADADVLCALAEIALATGNDVPLLVVGEADEPALPAGPGVRLARVVAAAGGRASLLPVHDDGPRGHRRTVAAVAAFYRRGLATGAGPVGPPVGG